MSSDITYFVRWDTESTPALMLGSDFLYPKDKNGVPCHYFWKEVLKPGKWRDARGVNVVVPPERIDRILSSFSRQKERGLFPFIPPSHNERSGDRNLGYIVDVRKSREGSLELLHQFIGDDAKLAASRNGTSLCTRERYRTQDGEVIDEFIDHNALIPDPAISDLKDFEPAIAASRGPAGAVYLQLASDERNDSMKLTDEHRRRLEKALPPGTKIPDEPDADAFIGLIESRAGEVVAALSRATKAEGETATIASEVEGLKLSRSRETQMDPERLYDRRRFVSTALDGLGDRGYSKATVDALRTYLVGDEKSPNVMMLSRENPDNFTSPIRAEKLIEILAGNVPVPPKGIQSGMQMARQTQGDPAAEEKKYDADYDAARASRNAQLEAQGVKP